MTRIFHNYPTDLLQKEAEELEQVFTKVALTPQQARVNRRIYQRICEELAQRFAAEVARMEMTA